MNFNLSNCFLSKILVISLACTLTNSLSASEKLAEKSKNSHSKADIEEVVVKGQYLYLDKVNSVKTPTPIINVPQSLSILTSESIQDQAFRNFGDIMRYTPGVSISQGEGHRDAIIIRGIQTTADFFIDGLRDDVQYFRPLYNVEQIEILRGSNALLFGRGGGGGVINRVQKKAKIGQNFNSITAGFDTFGAHSISADSNFAVTANSSLRLNTYYQGLDNHRDFYDGTSFAFNPTLTVDFNPSTTGYFSYEHVNDDRVVDRGVPSQNVENAPDLPLQGFNNTFFGSPDENFTTLEANIFRAHIDHTFSDRLRGNVIAQYGDYDKLYQNLYASEEVQVINNRFTEVELDGYQDTTDRENLIVQTNLIGEFETGNLMHTFLVGAEFGQQNTGNRRSDNVFDVNGDDQLFINFTDPLVIPNFAFTQIARRRASEVNFASLYIQDQLSLTDQFDLVLGLRYDQFDIDVFDGIEANDRDDNNGRFNRKDNEITPRLGAIYKPKDTMSVYASYSETFLPRSGDQFLTLNLDTESTRPQFFENTEIGFKWDINSNLSFTSSLFSLERESFTSIDPEDASQLIVIEGSETQGFEVQFAGELTDQWSITTGYSNLDGKVVRVDDSGNNGNKTRQTPDNMFSIWNNYAVNDRFSLGLGLNYQDSYFVREDNSVEVPSYTRVDAAAYYQLNDAIKLQLNIENLLDTNYFPDAHSNDNISTGKPLNGRVSVIYKF